MIETKMILSLNKVEILLELSFLIYILEFRSLHIRDIMN